MRKYGIISIILVVVCVVVCAVVLPGRNDDYYCALCNTIREEKYCLGTILIYRTEREYGKVTHWRECNGRHIWIFGSSHPYNGGKYGNIDGQYGFWYAHELIDLMEIHNQNIYKPELIALAKTWDGSNSSHQKLSVLINQMKIGLTRR